VPPLRREPGWVIHVRAVSPQDVTKRFTESLETNPGVLNLVVLEGAARRPDGDAVQFDVITAAANRVPGDLRKLEIDRRGSIIIENVDAELSDRAASAERLQPRALNRAPVCRAFDLQPRAFSAGIRPVSNLINTPNVFSVVVAVLAGIVGVVSLTEARTSTLLGVFISVTTIPAAADIGLSSAYGSWSEARGSLIQLLLNVRLLLAVGVVGLVLQRRLWERIAVQKTTHTDGPRP
jgi:Domain of unknown function (DUF389)